MFLNIAVDFQFVVLVVIPVVNRFTGFRLAELVLQIGIDQLFRTLANDKLDQITQFSTKLFKIENRTIFLIIFWLYNLYLMKITKIKLSLFIFNFFII